MNRYVCEYVAADECDCALQKGLLEVLYDIFRLPVPIITQDFTEAVLSVGTSSFTLTIIIHF